MVKPYRDLVNAGFLNYRADITHSWNPFSQQENKDVENWLCDIELNDQTEISCPDVENQNDQNYSETVSSELHTTILSDSEINSKIRSVNDKQRQIFDFIYDWAKSDVKVKCRTTSKQSTQFHIFLSGSGGCRILHLIKTVFHAVSKLFCVEGVTQGNLEFYYSHLQVLLQLISIVIHYILICIYHVKVNFFLLNDTNKAELRNKHSEVELKYLSFMSLLMKYQWFQVNYFIRYMNVQTKYLVLNKIFHLVENLFRFAETCVSYHQFVQNLYLHLMTLKQWKDL